MLDRSCLDALQSNQLLQARARQLQRKLGLERRHSRDAIKRSKINPFNRQSLDHVVTDNPMSLLPGEEAEPGESSSGHKLSQMLLQQMKEPRKEFYLPITLATQRRPREQYSSEYAWAYIRSKSETEALKEIKKRRRTVGSKMPRRLTTDRIGCRSTCRGKSQGYYGEPRYAKKDKQATPLYA